MKHAVFTAGAAIIAVSMLTGCASTGSPAPTPSKAAAPHVGASPYPKGQGSISTTVMTGCEKKPGAVKATGTYTVPTGAKGDQVIITVSWVNAKNANLLASNAVTLTGLKAGEREKWTARATLPKTDANVQCVVGAVIPQS